MAKKCVRPNSPITQKNAKDVFNQDTSKDNVKQDNQKADYVSLDIRQRKAVCNKPNQEFRFMYEEVVFLHFFSIYLYFNVS